MAVAMRASTQMTTQPEQSASLAWPTGSAVGDLAILVVEGDGHPGPVNRSGWVGVTAGGSTAAWYKRVTSGDLTSPVTCKGKLTGLQVYTGAAGIGKSRATTGVMLSVAGAGVLLFSSAPPPQTSVLPSGDHVGSVVIEDDSWAHQIFWLARSATGYVSLSGTDDSTLYYAWEVLPSVGPQAPTLVSPLAGAQVDTAAGVPFSWLPNSSSTQEQCKVRVRPWTSGGTGTWEWVKADGTWTTTDTALTQSAATLTLNAGILTTGTLYEWTVATYDSGVWSGYAPVQQLTPAARPTVTAITVTAPAEDLTPAIAWTRTAGAGSLAAWQCRVCASADATSDAPLWDSGAQAGTATSTAALATTAWTNGATLYAWVRVMQSGGLWSDWTKDDATFTVSWTAPAAPSTVTAANQASGPLRVTVAGIPTAMGLQVERSTDGSTWSSVVTITAPSATHVLDVPKAAYGVATYYRARTYSLVDSVRLYSTWTASSAVASTDTAAYLIDDTDETTWLAIEPSEDSTRQTVQGVSVSFGHGTSRARVDRSEARGEAGQTRLLVLSDAERAALVAWLTVRPVWWLRWSPERNTTATTDATATRMALRGAVSVDRLVQSDIAFRYVSFSWIEQ